MYDDDKSINVQLICKQYLWTYNTLRGMSKMSLSAPWTYNRSKQLFTNMIM